MIMAVQWTGRLGRCFVTTYLAGTAVLGASQYSDGVLTVLLFQMVVLPLNAAETKQSNITLLGYDTTWAGWWLATSRTLVQVCAA